MTPTEIKALRKRLGWTLAELGRELGVTRACVCLWEQGRTTPGGQSMLRLVALEEGAPTCHPRGLRAAEILTLRLRLGLTQLKFSRRLGIARKVVSDWERGVHRPSLLHMSRLQALKGSVA